MGGRGKRQRREKMVRLKGAREEDSKQKKNARKKVGRGQGERRTKKDGQGKRRNNRIKETRGRGTMKKGVLRWKVNQRKELDKN